MMSRCTTFARSLITTGALLGSIALTAIPAAPALAGIDDPFQVLYIFPGARDNGGAAGAGVATVIHCFSFSSTSEILQYTVRDFNGTLKANLTQGIASLGTETATTHDNVVYFTNLALNTGVIGQGTIGVSATSTNIVCTGQVMDASASVPNGVDLHAVRFNPISGSAE